MSKATPDNSLIILIVQMHGQIFRQTRQPGDGGTAVPPRKFVRFDGKSRCAIKNYIFARSSAKTCSFTRGQRSASGFATCPAAIMASASAIVTHFAAVVSPGCMVSCESGTSHSRK